MVCMCVPLCMIVCAPPLHLLPLTPTHHHGDYFRTAMGVCDDGRQNRKYIQARTTYLYQCCDRGRNARTYVRTSSGVGRTFLQFHSLLPYLSYLFDLSALPQSSAISCLSLSPSTARAPLAVISHFCHVQCCRAPAGREEIQSCPMPVIV